MANCARWKSGGGGGATAGDLPKLHASPGLAGDEARLNPEEKLRRAQAILYGKDRAKTPADLLAAGGAEA